MEKKTKQDIIDVAKKMFNERGFDNVSVREISEALRISKGNLTYYFKKKEDIAEAILESNGMGSFEISKNLEELHVQFNRMQQVVMDNAFYFGYYTQLANLSLKISEMQKNVVNLISMKLLCSFHFLSKQGYLIKERFDGEYECIVDTLMLNIIYWIPYNKMKDNDKESTFTEHAWKLIYGFLSDKGKSEVSIDKF